MSTRATVHFTYDPDGKPDAIVYRHSDGYPEGLGEDLKAFLTDIAANVNDTRFGDPSYLAAKWVVWDVLRGKREAIGFYQRMATENLRYVKEVERMQAQHPCEFLGVGIVSEDPGDINYRYTVTCRGGVPTIKVEEV